MTNKNITVLSYGGGVQSTAMLLKILHKEIDIKIDYIIFADTKNENSLLYHQLALVSEYVKNNFDMDIHIASNNTEIKTETDITKMINGGYKYRYSQYDDLYQAHILFFKGLLKNINVMPLWIRKPNGKIGKTPFKTCTNYYKITAIYRKLRSLLDVKQLRGINIKMLIGYSTDELSRIKHNPLKTTTNLYPLIDLNMDKDNCRKYVNDILGFTPISSVCNMCYANGFNTVYNIYKHDKIGWGQLIYLDETMDKKPIDHQIKNDVYMFRFQALIGKRLKDINMEELKTLLSNDDTFKREQEMSCMGGCFL